MTKSSSVVPAPAAQPGDSTRAASQSSPAPIEDLSAVCDLALTLFDRTRTLHDLGDDSRALLQAAARLQATPIPHARKKPYRAALAFARARVEQPFSEDGLMVLAAALAYHQGKLKRKQLAETDLSPEQVRQALAITALLEIACGLNAGRGGTQIQKVRQGEDGLWIVVDGPQASADAAAAQRRARLWDKLGYPKATVLEAGEAAIRLAPFPEPTEKIGMSANEPLAEAGRKALRFQFARMLATEDAARRGEDIEGVHDMRVATRRLRAAFEVFQEAFEPKALKPYLRGMRRTGRALGKVRDLDVLIAKGGRYCQDLPADRCDGLDALLQAWEAQRIQARAELLEYLDSKEYSDFKRQFNIFLNRPGAGVRLTPAGQPTPTRVRDLAPVLIYRRLAAVRAYGPYLENAPVELLHMLRIEFKKLRYTVEYFQEVLGRRSRDVIAMVKQLQDHLGDMNDAEVAAGLIEEFIRETEVKLAGMPAEQRAGLLAEANNYLAYQRAECERLVCTFPEAWQKIFLRPVFRRSLASAVSIL